MIQVAFGAEGDGAWLGVEDAAIFHLSIGTNDGIGIDGKVDGYAADGGKLVSNGYGAGGNGSLDLVNQLSVDGNTAVLVETEGEFGASGFCCRLHRATMY